MRGSALLDLHYFRLVTPPVGNSPSTPTLGLASKDQEKMKNGSSLDIGACGVFWMSKEMHNQRAGTCTLNFGMVLSASLQ